MLVRILIALEQRTCDGQKLVGLRCGGRKNSRLSSVLHNIGGVLATQSWQSSRSGGLDGDLMNS